ncbi:heterokaryon incompatibility protein-domain-containing protein, partial [Cerioporus squamosus]
MRLMNTETGQFVEINNPAQHIYAILSHTWDPEGEQSFIEITEIQRFMGMPILPDSTPSPLDTSGPTAPTLTPSTSPSAADIDPSSQEPRPSILDHPSVSLKIKNACRVARAYGYSLLWIDSCCIAKESSAELSEAINSMFRWYSCASVCFAFIPDLPNGLIDIEHHDERVLFSIMHNLRCECRWFHRGWTLQELVAPREVVFLNKHWQFSGTKATLADTLAAVTGIEAQVLMHQKRLDQVSVADRMRWASRRSTARVEDRAYSLFGIFSISLLIIYGEGNRAFLRLQKEILQAIPDQSLFLW